MLHVLAYMTATVFPGFKTSDTFAVKVQVIDWNVV